MFLYKGEPMKMASGFWRRSTAAVSLALLCLTIAADAHAVHIQAALDLYSTANGDDKWRSDFATTVQGLPNTTGEITTYGGAGARVGVFFWTPTTIEIGPSLGY